MQVAGAATVAVFALWLGTLGVRLAGPSVVATENGTQTINTEQSLPAAAAASRQDNAAHLEVSTTSVYETAPTY